jgi:hypothetical protein
MSDDEDDLGFVIPTRPSERRQMPDDELMRKLPKVCDCEPAPVHGDARARDAGTRDRSAFKVIQGGGRTGRRAR